MLFTEELRKCLNAAGLSDCGENDAWNYWYQRVLKAHNEAVERQIATEQAENAKLRELVRISIEFCADGMCGIYDGCPLNAADGRRRFDDRARELGVEVDA